MYMPPFSTISLGASAMYEQKAPFRIVSCMKNWHERLFQRLAGWKLFNFCTCRWPASLLLDVHFSLKWMSIMFSLDKKSGISYKSTCDLLDVGKWVSFSLEYYYCVQYTNNMKDFIWTVTWSLLETSSECLSFTWDSWPIRLIIGLF